MIEVKRRISNWLGASTALSRALLVLMSVWVTLSPHLCDAATNLTFLRTQGQDIVNERGQKILLRGVGLGNWLLPEGYMWKFGDNGDRPRKIEKLINDLIGPKES